MAEAFIVTWGGPSRLAASRRRLYPDVMQTAAMNAFAAIAGNGNHPTLPVDAVWAGVVVIVILFVFLAAAVIGPIVRALSPHQMPDGRAPIDPPSHH